MVSRDRRVPATLGRSAVTAENVTSALRLAYCFLPTFHDTQSEPAFFASPEVMPNRVVSPE